MCTWGVHVNKLPFASLWLTCLLLQGLSQEPGRAEGKYSSSPARPSCPHSYTCLLVTALTTHQFSRLPFLHFPRGQVLPSLPQKYLSYPTPLANLPQAHYPVAGYAHLFMLFCWDSWVRYPLLCTLLHFGFTTTCVLLIIGILFLNAAVIDKLI